MRWTPGGTSGDIEDDRNSSGGAGGGFPGGIHIGIGGLLVLLVLSFIFKRDLITPFLNSGAGGGSAPVSRPADPARNAAEQPEVQFVSFVLDDVQRTWTQMLPQYRHAKLVLFRDDVNSACGLAQTATGPFYCPGDEKVYLDLSFFNELKDRFGASGEFAQAYVIAHELGHHVQKILGTESKVRAAQEQNPRMANQLSVRLELQADCYAGVWGHSTEQRNILETGDVESGLNAAAAVGDDHIQKMTRGEVMPEKFTHGTSAQRVQWFKQGLTTGRVDACNTFASNQ
ncbi:MAG: neutral zinc metallopeptidase [Candidatus Acidiferrales bacterium]